MLAVKIDPSKAESGTVYLIGPVNQKITWVSPSDLAGVPEAPYLYLAGIFDIISV